MASIKRLKPGQVVYSIESHKMGNTTITTRSLYQVEIIEVNEELGYVVASWNGNEPKRYFEHSIAKWRVKKPTSKRFIFGSPSY